MRKPRPHWYHTRSRLAFITALRWLCTGSSADDASCLASQRIDAKQLAAAIQMPLLISVSSHTTPCAALMYSTLGYFSTFIRDDAATNDQYNSVAAAAVTGLLYKSTCTPPSSGIQKYIDTVWRCCPAGKKVATLPATLTITPGFFQTALRSGVPKLKYAAMTTVVFSTINYADILARQGAVKSYKKRNAPAMM